MNLVLIFLGFFLLVIGGEFIVRASVALSLRFNISKLKKSINKKTKLITILVQKI